MPRVSRQLTDYEGGNEMCTYLLAFTLARTPSNESFTTSHRARRGPLPPNEVDRIAQHVREGEGRKEGKDGESRSGRSPLRGFG
jgi:hypothetical protein